MHVDWYTRCAECSDPSRTIGANHLENAQTDLCFTSGAGGCPCWWARWHRCLSWRGKTLLRRRPILFVITIIDSIPELIEKNKSQTQSKHILTRSKKIFIDLQGQTYRDMLDPGLDTVTAVSLFRLGVSLSSITELSVATSSSILNAFLIFSIRGFHERSDRAWTRLISTSA